MLTFLYFVYIAAFYKEWNRQLFHPYWGLSFLLNDGGGDHWLPQIGLRSPGHDVRVGSVCMGGGEGACGMGGGW